MDKKRTIPNEVCGENGELQQAHENADRGKDENSCDIQCHRMRDSQNT